MIKQEIKDDEVTIENQQTNGGEIPTIIHAETQEIFKAIKNPRKSKNIIDIAKKQLQRLRKKCKKQKQTKELKNLPSNLEEKIDHLNVHRKINFSIDESINVPEWFDLLDNEGLNDVKKKFSLTKKLDAKVLEYDYSASSDDEIENLADEVLSFHHRLIKEKLLLYDQQEVDLFTFDAKRHIGPCPFVEKDNGKTHDELLIYITHDVSKSRTRMFCNFLEQKLKKWEKRRNKIFPNPLLMDIEDYDSSKHEFIFNMALDYDPLRYECFWMDLLPSEGNSEEMVLEEENFSSIDDNAPI